MLIIYTEYITNRLQYIATTLFGDDIVITNDINTFIGFDGKKINYSTNNILSSDVRIKPVNLLFEKTISNQHIECFSWKDYKAFYKTEGDIPFDVFAASFYLLSRYEEYLTDFKKDLHGNFHHENSLAWKENFLQQPLINFWLIEIEKKFKIDARKNQFKVIPTFDVDISFAYKHHPWYIQFGGLLKDLILKRGTFKLRLQVLFDYRKDPNQKFSWLNELIEKYDLNPIYFFLVSEKRGKKDKNPSPEKKEVKHLIQQLANRYSIGIHPSFQSNFSEEKLIDEIKILKTITNKSIPNSRQHYLQLKFPFTYKSILQHGILEDYTLGYGTHNGFRASYTYPYYWYNLENETESALRLHPFCYMDSNSIFEQNLSSKKALQEMEKYFEITKSVNGDFIFIMHNHFLTEQKKWKDWKKIFQEFLQFISTSSSS